jgi:hypothetical protein
MHIKQMVSLALQAMACVAIAVTVISFVRAAITAPAPALFLDELSGWMRNTVLPACLIAVGALAGTYLARKS